MSFYAGAILGEVLILEQGHRKAAIGGCNRIGCLFDCRSVADGKKTNRGIPSLWKKQLSAMNLCYSTHKLHRSFWGQGP